MPHPHKRLHQNVTVGFSLMALHSVFFAGLTMLYCAWKCASVLTNATRKMINDCSVVLYIITERWPGAKRYRDLFEAIKDPVLDTVDQHQNSPQTAVRQLQPGLHDALRSIIRSESRQDEFTAMLSEMSGGIQSVSRPEQQQYCGTSDSSFDMIPSLAFDFSLPLDTNTLDTFGPMSHDWTPADYIFDPDHTLSRSL